MTSASLNFFHLDGVFAKVVLVIAINMLPCPEEVLRVDMSGLNLESSGT